MTALDKLYKRLDGPDLGIITLRKSDVLALLSAAREGERLREALRQLTEDAVEARGCGLKNDEDGIVSSALFDTIMQARAALRSDKPHDH
jgi:hypothetical protein